MTDEFASMPKGVLDMSVIELLRELFGLGDNAADNDTDGNSTPYCRVICCDSEGDAG